MTLRGKKEKKNDLRRFLSVKKWLLRKKHQIELARKRGWKGYWVCLKGTTLLFYPCDSREGRSVEAAPKHLIIVDGAIMQPIPEHPKRDYIFCLSTAFGDAYLFQAPCQDSAPGVFARRCGRALGAAGAESIYRLHTRPHANAVLGRRLSRRPATLRSTTPLVELENWVNSIHSACAAAFARHRGKTGTLHLLQEEIYRLEKAIESGLSASMPTPNEPDRGPHRCTRRTPPQSLCGRPFDRTPGCITAAISK
ncbi:Protein still life, isoform SIF type 1 [Eumeta japonica]|uniref:Protein still life, isoform SIF type 1 n=1 Tax=Eumeta variegata TaxID=151549 RepID=A0A4C1TIC4_EUMVA|nr:Protein still life, isoform SIF type 1 [Eumeta japonica]